MRTVLIVAAEPFEVRWIEPPEGVRFIKVAEGAGPRLAGAATERAGKEADAVVSTGCCGALDPALLVGEVFVADTVNGGPATRPVTDRGFRHGPLLSVDRIVGTAAEKRKLFEAGYNAVEMEAAAVSERAHRFGVPFFCIRAVSDAASEDFSVDLNAARDGTGRIRISHILSQAARRPMAILPELLRLRKNADLAARSLGAFLATCRF